MCKIETRELIMVRFGRMCRAMSLEEAAEIRRQRDEKRRVVERSPLSLYDDTDADVELDISYDVLPMRQSIGQMLNHLPETAVRKAVRKAWRWPGRNKRGRYERTRVHDNHVRWARQHTHRQFDQSWFDEMAGNALEASDFEHLDAAVAFAAE